MDPEQYLPGSQGPDRTGSAQEMYRLLFESSLGLICTHTLDGHLTSINPEGARLLGYSQAELIGRSLHEIVAPKYRPEVGAYLDRIRSRGRDRGIMRVERRDGEERLWSYANQVAATSSGRYVLGHGQDVTEFFRIRAHVRKLARLDSTTGLPSLRSFTALVEAALEEASDRREVTMLLVNPVDFRGVNDQFGRPAGDRVLAEIGRLVRTQKKMETAHYGGATFAGLIRAPIHSAVEVARSMREELCFQTYLDGALRLDFNLGLASLTAAEAERPDAPLVLAHKASGALRQAASQQGGVVLQTSGSEGLEPLDSLSGIFTADLSTDYRNMLLIWNVLSVLSNHAKPREIAARILQALIPVISLTRARLVGWRDGEEYAWIEEEPMPDERGQALEPELASRLAHLGEGGDHLDECLPEAGLRRVAMTLVSHGRKQGYLILEGRNEVMRFGEYDLHALKSIAGQVAVALDRATLVEKEIRLQQEQSEQLEREVDELRELVTRTKLVFGSKSMRQLMEKTGRIAVTEASVLVTGESGTGKEVIARVIHDLSPRRGVEPVTVDLSTMSPTVIESELFGHVKGAFTGADKDSPGRLVRAEGGTVILDEIGELPLQAQAKLLRFVQEKEIVPVGGSEVRSVDARIVACTNRDLAAEVRAGRFREDLYFRLNVLRLHLPPLVQRDGDIPLLASHFLRVFAAQYGRSCRLSPDALAALNEYSWPGNVRELQNCLLQSVILSRSDVLTVEDLDLRPGEAKHLERIDRTPRYVHHLQESWDGSRQRSSDSRSWPQPIEKAEKADTVGSLESLLARLVEAELASPPPFAPLGIWLAEDLIRLALESADGVASQAAALLDLPGSTLRRKAEKVRTGSARRPDYWNRMTGELSRLVQSLGGPGSSLFEKSQSALLRAVLTCLPEDPRLAASIVGLSLPTLRRRRRDLGL